MAAITEADGPSDPNPDLPMPAGLAADFSMLTRCLDKTQAAPRGTRAALQRDIRGYLRQLAADGHTRLRQAMPADYHRYVWPREGLAGQDWLEVEQRHLTVTITHLLHALALGQTARPVPRLPAPIRDSDSPWPDTDRSVTAIRLAALLRDRASRRGTGVFSRNATVVAICSLGGATKEAHLITPQHLLAPPPAWQLQLPGDGVCAERARRGQMHERKVLLDGFALQVLVGDTRFIEADSAASLLYRPRTRIYKAQAAITSVDRTIGELRAAIGTPKGLRAPNSLRQWAARRNPRQALLVLGLTHDHEAAQRNLAGPETDDEPIGALAWE